VKNRRQLKPLGKRSVSTWPHASTLREFLADCEQRGQTVSVRLRQILDEYYSNERLKAIGRDVIETPIRRVQREAISEELVPLKNRVAEIEKGVQATRSIAEDVLGRLAQISLGVGAVSPEINGDYVQRLELAVSQLASYPVQLSGGDDGAAGNDKGHVLLNDEVVRRLDEVKALTAKLVLRALRNTIRAAVQAELKTGHILRVQVGPETGVEVYAEFEVVEKVANPEIELTLDEARRRCGATAQLGSKVWLRFHSDVDAVRVIAQAANEFLRRE
jgi:NusA N-terminal domain